MTDFSADKLRALDEQHRTRLITTLRNWQREMERSCDALRKLGPDMEDAAMGNAHVAEALEEAADAILAMAEERERSEKHRNDLADRITDQSITIGALKADNARIRETGMQLAFAAGALNIATDGMADMDEARRIVLDRLKDWKSALGEEPKP